MCRARGTSTASVTLQTPVSEMFKVRRRSAVAGLVVVASAVVVGILSERNMQVLRTADGGARYDQAGTVTKKQACGIYCTYIPIDSESFAVHVMVGPLEVFCRGESLLGFFRMF